MSLSSILPLTPLPVVCGVDNGAFNLPYAPIFFSTEEEFKDVWKFLNSIRDVVEQTGICVIQPPLSGGWDFKSFEKRINPKKFSFVTKAQNIHQMHRRNGPNVAFVQTLKKFWKDAGKVMESMPLIHGEVLDVYQLKLAVEKFGGLETIEQNNHWPNIASYLHLLTPTDTQKSITPICTQLRSHFLQYLKPFLDSQVKVDETEVEEGVEKECKEDCENKEEQKSEGGEVVDVATDSEECKKRRCEWLCEERPVKRMKSLTTKDEPLWSQVRSRSFAKDANDIRESLYDGTKRMRSMRGKHRTGTPSPLIYDADDTTEDEETEDPEVLTKDFGYGMGRKYNLVQFQEMAINFEKRWPQCITPHTREKEYWRIVESGEEFIQVQYGSDLDVAKHGSGFPFNSHSKFPHVSKEKARKLQKCETEPSSYMVHSGWNTNNIAGSTFLHHLGESVAGLTRPMVYVGMMFSSFCWHTEDNYLYSINYLHYGQPKLWYGVPSSAADAFEKTMRAHLPDLFDRNPNLLHLLVTQLSPRVLQQAGVPVYTTLQTAGQFVVTCPRSYHAGFNTGYNCAESVNFALEDWLPFCRKACDIYRYNRSAVFPFEEFVVKGARHPDNLKIAEIFHNEIISIISQEELYQTQIYRDGIKKFVTVKSDKKSDKYLPCCTCGYDCYLSGIRCNAHPGVMACLQHLANICTCPVSEKRLVVRVPLTELRQILDDIPKNIVAKT